jgi:subtilisin family serine protease
MPRPWITPERAKRAISEGRGRGVRIAVLDSGIEVSHPLLRGLVLSDDLAVLGDHVQLQTVAGGGIDVFGHGTAIAGILREMAPEAEIGSFRVLGQHLASRTAIIREGARLAIERGYHIINCSLGCGVLEHVLHYKDWVDEAYMKGIHVVAACNNADFARTEWPGHFSSVVTVNMADTPDDMALFFKRGHLVEFAARGVNVPVPWLDGSLKIVTGSSFAAPRVAGLLARLLSLEPDIAPLGMKALLHHIAQPLTPEVLSPNASARLSA